MSNYNRLVIFILVLLVISVAIVYIDSSVNTINKSMPEISDGIVKGDAQYNEAVILVNDKNYTQAMNKAVSASNNYNVSLKLLKDIKNNFSSDINDVHKSYINSAIEELELKINATNYLISAIDSYSNNKNSTGSDYAVKANNLMDDAVEFQNVRDELVKTNPDLFTQNSYLI